MTIEETTQVVARIDEAWAELERTLAALSDHDLAGVRDRAGWAVKDHLVHVAAWEQALLAGLEAVHVAEQARGVDEVDLLHLVGRERRARRHVLESFHGFSRSWAARGCRAAAVESSSLRRLAQVESRPEAAGVRLVTDVVDAEPDAVSIGAPVEIVSRQVHESVWLPVARLVAR